MRVLAIYDSTTIVSAQIAEQVTSIYSPENFICDTYENVIAFFTLRGFDTSIVENLKSNTF